MKEWVFIVLSVLITTILLVGFVGHENHFVGIYFYPWYSINPVRHWNESSSTTVVDKPIWRFYDSRNTSIINQQLRLIREAGIDFIVFSWWGANSFEDNATRIIVEYLRNYNLKFAIMIEPYLGSDHPEYYNYTFWNNTLNYIKTNYIDPYNDIYVYLDGKPLVLAFNPIGMNYNPSNDFPQYTIRITGNDIDNAKYQDWDYWPDYIDVSNVELKIRIDGFVSIMPRYDDTFLRSSGICIDQNYTERLYVREWEWILMRRDQISIVMITSWNEYHERTMIEPHIDYTANVDPYYIYNITKNYIHRLKQDNNILPSYIYGFCNYVLAWALAFFIFGAVSKFILRTIR
ncbi:hypothetical protein [Staphylothermus marinus]|nr:hypothetical protein [Staphylothermus marinus]